MYGTNVKNTSISSYSFGNLDFEYYNYPVGHRYCVQRDLFKINFYLFLLNWNTNILEVKKYHCINLFVTLDRNYYSDLGRSNCNTVHGSFHFRVKNEILLKKTRDHSMIMAVMVKGKPNATNRWPGPSPKYNFFFLHDILLSDCGY